MAEEEGEDVLSLEGSEIDGDIGDVIIEDYLQKRGHRFKSWKTRWFRLVNGVLEYYYVVDEEQFRLKGTMNVAGTTITALDEEDYGRQHSFCVTSTFNRDFLVAAAPTAAKRDTWVRVLTHVAKACVHKHGVLNKRTTGLRKSFQPRYFILNGVDLFYYKRKEGKLLGQLSMKDSEVTELTPDEAGGERYAFEILTVTKTLTLKAPTAGALHDWLDAFRQAGTSALDLHMFEKLEGKTEETQITHADAIVTFMTQRSQTFGALDREESNNVLPASEKPTSVSSSGSGAGAAEPALPALAEGDESEASGGDMSEEAARKVAARAVALTNGDPVPDDLELSVDVEAVEVVEVTPVEISSVGPVIAVDATEVVPAAVTVTPRSVNAPSPPASGQTPKGPPAKAPRPPSKKPKPPAKKPQAKQDAHTEDEAKQAPVPGGEPAQETPAAAPVPAPAKPAATEAAPAGASEAAPTLAAPLPGDGVEMMPPAGSTTTTRVPSPPLKEPVAIVTTGRKRKASAAERTEAAETINHAAQELAEVAMKRKAAVQPETIQLPVPETSFNLGQARITRVFNVDGMTYKEAEIASRMVPRSDRWGPLKGNGKFCEHPCSPHFSIRHYPALSQGTIHLTLVLDRRPSGYPHLPTLNHWQHRQCASCGKTQSTGAFGTKAQYCYYTELMFCPKCFGSNLRAIPWRVVHDLDTTKYRVCNEASDYLERIWDVPLLDLNLIDAEVFASRPELARMQQLRGELHKLKARLPGYVAQQVLKKCIPQQQYLYEVPNFLAPSDFVEAASGKFVPLLATAIEKLHLEISENPEVSNLRRQRFPLSGYLHKQSHQSSKWLRRWFVLEDGVIRYSKRKGGNIKGMMTFTDLSSVRLVTESPLPYVMLVDNGVPDQYMYLQAATPSSLRGWVFSLRQHMGILEHEADDFDAWDLYPTDEEDAADGSAGAGSGAGAGSAQRSPEGASGKRAPHVPAYLPPRVSGYLSKRGHRLKTWQNRWFMLDDGELVYYAKRNGEVKGTLQLKPTTEVSRDAKIRKNCIHVFNSKKEQLYLQVLEEAHWDKWFNGLNNHVAYLQEQAKRRR